MSFLKKLFGGGGGEPQASEPVAGAEESYKGYTIKALIMPVGSEYQLAGIIEKTVDGEVRTHNFVRADRMTSKDDALSFSLAKGRQIIDEQGDAVFAQSWPTPAN